MNFEGLPVFVIMIFSAPAVHSGSKTALVVSVMTDDGAKDKTPFEGSVNGVQCAVVRVAVVGFP